MYKPTYLENIDDVSCVKKYIYNRGNGRKTAYCHFVDGLEVWEFCPSLWNGWKIMHRIIGEKEVY